MLLLALNLTKALNLMKSRMIKLALAILLAPCFATAAVQIDLPISGISYSSATGNLYATVESSAGPMFGNRLLEISPISGQILASVFVGSEPGPIGTSPDSAVAWVGMRGAPQFRRIDLATMTAGTTFNVGIGSLSSLFVEDIEVMPGFPETVAISRRNQGFSPRHEGVAVYDAGVIRATTTPGHTGSNSIEFTQTGSNLIGLNNETTEFGLREMTVSPNGVTIVRVVPANSGFGTKFAYNDGSICPTT